MGTRRSQEMTPGVEPCEDRTLQTLVFVLNGNALSAASPNSLTANAAAVLQRAGDRAVQLSTPTINTPGAFYSVARQIKAMSHGQPIGIVGFSAGGTLAIRLAGLADLHVTDVLDYYGPPDLSDWLNYHHGDRDYNYVVGHVHFTPATVQLLSGPCSTSAHIVCAFGLRDTNVVASVSTSSLRNDYAQGNVYDYDAGHGVSIGASAPALEDFLAHLQPSQPSARTGRGAH